MRCHFTLLYCTQAVSYTHLTLDNFLVQLYNILRHGLQSPFRMLCRNFILPEFANYVSFFLLSFCATYLTLSLKFAKWDRQLFSGFTYLLRVTLRFCQMDNKKAANLFRLTAFAGRRWAAVIQFCKFRSGWPDKLGFEV